MTTVNVSNIFKNIQQNYYKTLETKLSKITHCNNVYTLSSFENAVNSLLDNLNIYKGDKVLCSTFSNDSIVKILKERGIEIIFIDSEPDTWNMSPIALVNSMMDNKHDLPAAVFVSNVYGKRSKMHMIQEICDQYNVTVIEDISESFLNSPLITPSKNYNIMRTSKSDIISSTESGLIFCNNKLNINSDLILSNLKSEKILNELKTLSKVIHLKKETQFVYNFVTAKNVHIPPMINNLQYETSCNVSCTTIYNKDINVIIDKCKEYNVALSKVHKPLHTLNDFSSFKIYKHIDNDPDTVAEYIYNHSICFPVQELKLSQVVDVAQYFNKVVEQE